MGSHRMEGEEQEEGLFRSYPCAYYVQSPSTLSHANSADCRNNESVFHSPLRSESTFTHNNINPTNDASRFTLSRYSSRGSNHSFLHEKKMAYDLQSDGAGSTDNGEKALIIVHDGIGDGGDDDDGDDEKDYYYGRKDDAGWWRFFSFRTSSSCAWICLQICWRLLVSLGAALLVFYIATKPPSPKVAIQVAGIRQFGLGEGVDATGVTTKILNCNCSIHLLVDNKSKLFTLHVQPALMKISFGNLPFAITNGPKLYAESYRATLFELFVGTRNKPMYGAGRSMQDKLESGKGLPLIIHVSLRSSFRVLWNLIRPEFRHQAECQLLLTDEYDKKHRTQFYTSTCKST